jgi:hypothetical protein
MGLSGYKVSTNIGLVHPECGLTLRREGGARGGMHLIFFLRGLVSVFLHISLLFNYSDRLSQRMGPVRRIAQIVHLKPSAVAAYKECHANVWPEVLRQIKDCNIKDCTF